MRFPLAPALPLVMCAAVISSACHTQETIEEPPTPVRVSKVQTTQLGGGVRYSANVEAESQVTLAFKSSGYVRDILTRRGADGRVRPLQAGDRVARGTVLARVANEDYTERARQARASLAEAEAAREKARTDLERATALLESKSLTRADHDAAKASSEAAEARRAGAAAVLQQAEIALADCELKAPADSVVLERRIEVGNLVGPGSVGFVLADTSSVKVVFGAPDLLVESLSPGDVMTLTTDALGGREFSGRVTSVSPAADPHSRVFDVEVTVENSKGDLKVGMIATVRVPGPLGAGKAGTALPLIPISAVVRPPGGTEGYAVFVVDGEGERRVARSRKVELGEVYGNLIAVDKGLSPGEQVIVTGAQIVTDGQIVRVVP